MTAALPGDRERLRDAFKIAERYNRDKAAPLSGVAIGLRTLGLGQVLQMLERSDDAGIGKPLVEAVRRFLPKVNGPGVLDLLAAWVDIQDRQLLADVEEHLTAWVVDIKLLANLSAWLETRLLPSPEDRAEAAALAAMTALGVDRGMSRLEDGGYKPDTRSRAEQKELKARVQALTWEIQQHGVVRALAVLCRESSAKEKEGLPVLAQAVLDRLGRFVAGDVVRGGAQPPKVRQVLEAALSDGSGPALEAEALLFAVELKRWVTALVEEDERPERVALAMSDVPGQESA